MPTAETVIVSSITCHCELSCSKGTVCKSTKEETLIQTVTKKKTKNQPKPKPKNPRENSVKIKYFSLPEH